MNLSESILKSVRGAVGLTPDTSDFDIEILMHINSCISKLNQNGVGNSIVVTDDTSTWNDLQNPEQVEGNVFFQLIPLYVSLSTKLLFDPPPPSSVEYHSNTTQELLWRLKLAYEELSE